MNTERATLEENWKTGPIGDKPLEPGHDRPVTNIIIISPCLRPQNFQITDLLYEYLQRNLGYRLS